MNAIPEPVSDDPRDPPHLDMGATPREEQYRRLVALADAMRAVTHVPLRGQRIGLVGLPDDELALMAGQPGARREVIASDTVGQVIEVVRLSILGVSIEGQRVRLLSTDDLAGLAARGVW